MAQREKMADGRDPDFKDHFSDRAAAYARFRPTYPDELFERLAAIAPARELAWDCATGNGQAALGLARHFRRVLATDASERQIANAIPAPRVEYRTAREAASGLDDETVDLVTVAQAFHWLDPERFWPEARRVLRPGGVAAVWGYRLARVTPAIDAVVDRFYADRVGPWWPEDRVHLENGYRDLPFSIDPIPMPPPVMRDRWSLARMCGYLRTWSATRRFIADRGFDPVDAVEEELEPLWGDREREVVWPLVLKVGRPLPT